jgi:tripartite-type tricarboxylate transporter receptor subunit TctC
MSPSLQRAAQVPSAGANAFQKQGALGAMRTQLQRPLFGGVLALERGHAMEFRRRRFLHLTAAAVAGLFASPLARAQDYPTRAVTIVVPFTPGGSTDIIARMLAQKLEQRLGKSFVVENRPGAGTIIAASAIAKAAPDGYVLLMAPSSTMAVNVTLYKKLPYDPPTDFIPLAGLARVPFVLLVNPSLPVHSLPELIAYAKARPGQLSFASVGPGVPHHLYAELLMSTAGIAMTHVPYKGSAPALNDVVAGHIPLMFSDIAPAVGMLQAGKVRPLGVTTRTRVPAFPDIPPIAEAGLPEFGALPGWHMLVAPGKTPRDIVAKLHAELLDILALPEIETEILRLGMLPFENRSVEGLRDFVKSETVRWGKVVQQAGIAGSE